MSIEKTQVWHLPQFGGLELHHASYVRQSFPKHTHERYVFGVIETGALGFYYRGENIVAAPGQISLCIPGEPHTGHAAGDAGWMYRMFYLEPAFLQTVAGEVANRPKTLPFFTAGVLNDPALAQQIHQLHRQLTSHETTLLEKETRLTHMLATFIQRHADDRPVVKRPRTSARAVTQVRAYIEANYGDDISLDALSHEANVSRYHLIHLFRDAMGVPPHAYLRQVRVRRAKALLAAGSPIAEAAAMTGFTDQSHLTRWFKRLWGVTPGQYRNSVQSIMR